MSMCPDAWLPNCQGPPRLSPPLLRSPCSFWGVGTRRAASQGCSLQAAPVRGALLEAAELLERPVHTCCLPSSPPISSSTHCFLTCSAPPNDPTSGPSSRPTGCSPQPAPGRPGLCLLQASRPVWGLPAGPSLLHLFVSLLMSTSRLLPPKTMQQPCPRHTGWAGRRPRWKRPEQPPEDRRSVPGSPLSCLSPVPCLSTCTRVGLKTPSGILHGRRDLHAPPSTLRRSNRQTRMEVPL
ncbi:uncharacterized protein LOC116591903 isoform X2 [Mustela erminea]|uniref:uncharacterized protein LOC116591903 isoform X2 n=1 Tax=Mustela erminea TaxID=36723 RepID=UPI00138667F1|nr:uncharacterized protein LOC116591903 isoform X2 [Mustela erminea]